MEITCNLTNNGTYMVQITTKKRLEYILRKKNEKRHNCPKNVKNRLKVKIHH